MSTQIIDLSQGRNGKEIDRLITSLPCSETDKLLMRSHNKIIEAIDDIHSNPELMESKK